VGVGEEDGLGVGSGVTEEGVGRVEATWGKTNRAKSGKRISRKRMGKL